VELKRAAEPAFEAKNRPGVRQGQSRSAIGEPARAFVDDRETGPDGELPHEIDLTTRESRCPTSFSTTIVTSLRPQFIGARTELRSRSSTDPVYVELEQDLEQLGYRHADASERLLERSRLREGPEPRSADARMPRSAERATMNRERMSKMLSAEQYREAEFGYMLEESRKGFVAHVTVFGLVMTSLIANAP